MYENGTSYENIQPTTEQASFQQVIPTPAPAPTVDGTVYGAPAYPAPTEPAPEPKKKKSKLLIVSIIINILLILGIIASVVFFYIIPKIQESKKEEPAPVVESSEYAFFNQGLAKANMNDKYGFINEKGEWVIKAQYDVAIDFMDNGLAAVGMYGGDEEESMKVGFIDKEGNFAIDLQPLDNISMFCGGAAMVARYDDDGELEYALMDEKGNLIVDYGKYDYIGGLYNDVEYCQVEKDGKYGIINTAGEEVVALGEYEYIYDVYSDGFIFGEDKKLGFADFEGNVIIVPELEILGYANIEDRCEEDGCYEYASYDGYCEEHAEMPYCSYAGCYNSVEEYYDDYCSEHSDLPYCRYGTCYNRVESYYDDYCWDHSYLED